MDKELLREKIVEESIFELSRGTVVECGSIGIDGALSEKYLNFKTLKKNATLGELYSLLNHSNDVVFLYASYALIDLERINPYFLFKYMAENDKEIYHRCTCLVEKETLSSLIYRRYRERRTDQLVYLEEYQKGNYNYREIFDSESLQKMDSLILSFRNVESSIFKMALSNRISDNRFRDRLLEGLVFDSKRLGIITEEFKRNDLHAKVKMRYSFEYFAYIEKYKPLLNKYY